MANDYRAFGLRSLRNQGGGKRLSATCSGLPGTGVKQQSVALWFVPRCRASGPSGVLEEGKWQ